MTYQLIRSSEAQFESLKNAFNQRWTAPNLESVYVCYTGQDVADALNNARSAIKPGEVSILGGGHCYENFVYNEQTKVIIDVTGIKRLDHKQETGITEVGAGYTNWGVGQILFKKYNLQLPAGSCYSVGLGGHITGGGYGLSSRAYGLTVDHIDSFEVVVFDAQSNSFKLIRADADTNKDLFVAMRGGGGGNFGVITNYIFKDLPKAFANADIFSIAIDWADITKWKILKKILEVYSTYCANVGTSPAKTDKQLSPNIFTLGKFTHHSQGQIAFTIQSAWNDKKEQDIQTAQIGNFHNDLLAINDITPTYLRFPLAGYPTLDPIFYGAPSGTRFDLASKFASQSMSWIDATMSLNGSGPNRRGCYNSAYFRTMLTDIQIKSLYNYLAGDHDNSNLDYSATLLQIDSYGGKINQYSQSDTSIKQRSSIMKGQFQIYWNDGYNNTNNLDSAYVSWLDGFFKSMFGETGGFPDPDYQAREGQTDPVSAKASVDGCYVNYPNSNLGTNGGTLDIYHALNLYFGREITQSLIAAKRQYDEKNWFRHAQSIPTLPQKGENAGAILH